VILFYDGKKGYSFAGHVLYVCLLFRPLAVWADYRFFSLEAKVWHLFSSFLFWFSGRLTLMI
jgi:hypothetical protein